MSKKKLILGGFVVGALVAGVFATSKNKKVRSTVKKYTVDNDKLKKCLIKGKEIGKNKYTTTLATTKNGTREVLLNIKNGVVNIKEIKKDS